MELYNLLAQNRSADSPPTNANVHVNPKASAPPIESNNIFTDENNNSSQPQQPVDLELLKQLAPFILSNASWETLPPHIKQREHYSEEQWKRDVLQWSVNWLQLAWKDILLVQFLISDERLYYLELMRLSKLGQMVFTIIIIIWVNRF